jgi:hypothetical protein
MRSLEGQADTAVLLLEADLVLSAAVSRPRSGGGGCVGGVSKVGMSRPRGGGKSRRGGEVQQQQPRPQLGGGRGAGPGEIGGGRGAAGAEVAERGGPEGAQGAGAEPGGRRRGGDALAAGGSIACFQRAAGDTAALASRLPGIVAAINAGRVAPAAADACRRLLSARYLWDVAVMLSKLPAAEGLLVFVRGCSGTTTAAAAAAREPGGGDSGLAATAEKAAAAAVRAEDEVEAELAAKALPKLLRLLEVWRARGRVAQAGTTAAAAVAERARTWSRTGT